MLAQHAGVDLKIEDSIYYKDRCCYKTLFGKVIILSWLYQVINYVKYKLIICYKPPLYIDYINYINYINYKIYKLKSL